MNKKAKGGEALLKDPEPEQACTSKNLSPLKSNSKKRKQCDQDSEIPVNSKRTKSGIKIVKV